jgi:hypothetical protein
LWDRFIEWGCNIKIFGNAMFIARTRSTVLFRNTEFEPATSINAPCLEDNSCNLCSAVEGNKHFGEEWGIVLKH